MNIGKSVVIKGELNGSEDLTIEGHVEGKIELKDHVLTIGPNGRIKAQVFAKTVIVLGEVNGNVSASEKVEIRDGGSVDGDIVSPRVAIAEGAHFRGSVDMQKQGRHPPPASAQASSPRRSRRRAGTDAAPAARPSRTSRRRAADPEWAVAFSDLFSRRRKDEPEPTRAPPRRPCIPPRSLAKFLAGLSGAAVSGAARPRPRHRLERDVLRRAARLQDHRRGPVEGHRSRGQARRPLAELPAFFAKRFSQEDDSVDGVLCWDLFDYLDKHAAAALASQIVAHAEARWRGARVLQHPRTERAGPAPMYTKHVVVDQATLQYRPYPAARGKQQPFQNRDIQRMFEPLRITEQFLLKSHMREVLFRKRAPPQPRTPDGLRPLRRAPAARAVGARVGGPRGRAAHPRARSRAPVRSPRSCRRWRRSGCSASRCPSEYGGAGMDYLALGLASEELEYVDTSLRVILSVHVGLNSLTLLSWGTDDQKQRYLVPQAQGEALPPSA